MPIPNEATIKKVIGDTVEKVVEGSLRVEALKKHLTNYNTTLEVWMSEDGSGVINKVEYDPSNNSLVGLIIPRDENSMPYKMYFQATTAKKIEDYYKAHAVASLIYIYVAQANNPDVPPFCLLFFGTDNRMLLSDVQRRQNYISNELKNTGIRVLGYSGDGDSRVLKAMRISAGLRTRSYANDEDSIKYRDIPVFQVRFVPESIPVQDEVHMTNRGRTCLMKPMSFLPMGNFVASSNDLITLVKCCTKDKRSHAKTK